MSFSRRKDVSHLVGVFSLVLSNLIEPHSPIIVNESIRAIHSHESDIYIDIAQHPERGDDMVHVTTSKSP